MPVLEPEQRLDQGPRTNHLRDEVEKTHNQRADTRRGLNTSRLKAAVEGVRERELSKAFEGFGNDEQGYDPACQIPDGIKKSIKSVESDHAANP